MNVYSRGRRPQTSYFHILVRNIHDLWGFFFSVFAGGAEFPTDSIFKEAMILTIERNEYVIDMYITSSLRTLHMYKL